MSGRSRASILIKFESKHFSNFFVQEWLYMIVNLCKYGYFERTELIDMYTWLAYITSYIDTVDKHVM